VSALSAGVLAASIVAQGPPPQRPPTIRTRVDAVSVDVVATDAKGAPVGDLTAADFEIREDGKPQTIDSFKRITLEDDPVALAGHVFPPIDTLAAQEREASRDDVRIIAVFLDDYHTRLLNAARVRDTLAKFVAGLNERDLVAVMYPLTPTSALTFSRDHEGTARAIRKFEGRKYDYFPRFPQEDAYIYLEPPQIEALRTTVVVEALEGLAIALGGLRESRKTILFVGEGLTTVLPPSIARRPGSPPASATSPGRQQALTGSTASLERLQQIIKAASRANTAIYTLDPRGLTDSDFDIVADPTVDVRRGQAALRDSIDQLKVLADQTGGRAGVNTNDPLPVLHEMLTDTGTYYLVGYTSTQAPRDGKFHAIKVSVKRRDVEIRARPGYWAYTNEDVARAMAPEAPALDADRAAALAAVAAPKAGRLIQTWAGFDRASAGPRTAVTIVWELDAAAAASRGAHRVSLVATAANGDVVYRGRPSDPQATAGRVTFDAPPGTLHLRASLQGEAGEFLDSEEREVQVADLTGAGPLVTTPEIYRARTPKELAELGGSASALPTAGRRFGRTDRLLVRFRAYGPGGTSPAVALRFVNVRGEIAAALPPPARNQAGAYEAVLPIGSLAPGNYLLEIEAAAGDGRARTIVGFSITP
jgi:VWFA-related protein